MSKVNWKVAALGGAAIGAAVGGFTLAGADSTDTQPVRDVDLQSYRDDLRSLSSPVEVTTTTQAPASAPTTVGSPASALSVDSPVAPAPQPPVQAPAPAPVYDSPDSPASPVQPVSQDSADSFSAAST